MASVFEDPVHPSDDDLMCLPRWVRGLAGRHFDISNMWTVYGLVQSCDFQVIFVNQYAGHLLTGGPSVSLRIHHCAALCTNFLLWLGAM
jgi:hypothetical protein